MLVRSYLTMNRCKSDTTTVYDIAAPTCFRLGLPLFASEPPVIGRYITLTGAIKSTFKQPIISTTRHGTAPIDRSKDLSELNIPPKASIEMCCVYLPRLLGLPGCRQLRNLPNTTPGLKREYTGKLWKAFLPIPPGTLLK